MSSDGDELHRLFAEELRRRRATLADEAATLEEKRRALHALKGAAGMLGESALADSLARLERRVRAGEGEAVASAVDLLARVEEAYGRGERAPAARWPTPPEDLAASVVSDVLRPTYESEMRERVSRIDAALATSDAEAALASILRDLHAMKGAAGAAADEVTTWFCHGLEAELREARQGPGAATRALTVVASVRGVLGEVFVDAPRALARLRGAADRPSRTPISTPSTRVASARRTTARPAGLTDDDGLDDGLTRIPVSALDRLVERVGHLGRVGGQLGASLDQGRASARALRQLGTTLAEALRLIGPPRPWGAPAAAIARVERGAAMATAIADELEFNHSMARDRADDLVSETTATSSELRQLRRTRAGWLFDRVESAIEGQARREGRLLSVVSSGADLQVDRRLLEQLVDPVLQIARNALAHGFESPGARVAAGKPPSGTLTLSASFDATFLRVVVEDDGAGVDVELVRRRAIEANIVPEDVAAEASDEALFDLLFVPGFTTRARADALAGRGMGLDLALGALRRVGGALRLSSRAGQGVTATLEIPTESGSTTVLWVTSRGETYALPARDVARVSLSEPGDVAPTLATLVSGAEPEPSGFLLDLATHVRPGVRLRIGVEKIGGLEDVALRAVSPIVQGAGPYRAAVVRPDGRLDLVLSADALAELSA